jgi:type IV secretory pathway VirB2 component (pilin)
MTFTLPSRKRLAVVGLATLATLSVATTAALASTDVGIMDTSCGYLSQIQRWVFGAAYVLGAIGLVIIAVSAFLGRFKFSHLIALGGGLFIIAMADALLRFITSGQGGTNSCVAPT